MTKRKFEMYQYRQVLVRMRQGDSDREIARFKTMGRKKIAQVRELANARGWLATATDLPEDAVLAAALERKEPLASTCISTLEPWRAQIANWYAAGIQGTTIHATLARNHGYKGSPSAVYRFLHQLVVDEAPQVPLRLMFKPAEAAQVDFGAGPPITDVYTGEIFKTWFFVMTLAWSRHQYAEFVRDQSVATWLGCHRRAFESFSGTPARIIIDNAKCAITKACVYEPEVQRAYGECAEGYSFQIEPCPPRDPQKKESDSYCTLCGWLNSDKCRGGRAVATSLSLDEDDVAEGFEQAALLISVTLLAQESALPPLVYRRRADGKLDGEFIGREHAAITQSRKAGLELVGIADNDDLLVRE